MSCGLPWAPGLEEVSLISALPSCCLERPQIPESSPEGQHANHLAPALGLRGKKLVGIPDSCSWAKELCCLILCSSCLPPLPSFGPALAPLYSQSKFFPAQLSLRTLPKFPTWLCSCKVSYPTTNPMFLYLVLTLKKTAAKYTCKHTLVHNHMLARTHNHIRDKTSYWEVGMWMIQDLVQNDDCK